MTKKPSEIGYVKPRILEDEMRESYLDYAMSVIVARALPDVRDGLKPVHRRVLYAMSELGLTPQARYRKSATVVGEVLGKFHPHGDVAVYDSLVRLAQNFAMRYPLVDGQGNFGCFTGDTKIALTDGRSLTFKELVKEHKAGKKNYTHTFNPQTNSIEIAEIKNPRLTKKNAQVVEVWLDNKEKICCTPDHRFMKRDGSYTEARLLKNDESLMPLSFRFSTQADDANAVGYRMIWQPMKRAWDWVHRLADQWNLKHCLYPKSTGRIRHHLDFNKLNQDLRVCPFLSSSGEPKARPGDPEMLKYKPFFALDSRSPIAVEDKFRGNDTKRVSPINNNPDNIKRMDWKEHWKLHYQLASERHKNDPEYVAKLKAGRDNYWAKPENRERNAQELSERSKKWWQNPQYKKTVVKSKILGFVNQLITKGKGKVTPEVYEQKRINNGIPRFGKAIAYFPSLEEMVKQAKIYNHKVTKVKYLKKKFDVYDLTIDATHNFALAAGVFVHNSLDGDPPAAMRYTECRLAPITTELLTDLDKDTVAFMDNYDATKKEPTVLPTKLPNLLLNGTLGIAVGMATDIPPHNLSEIVDATTALIDQPRLTSEDLMTYVQGPDFPTGGMIYDWNAIKSTYATGKGSIVMRAKTEIVEQKTGGFQILITEIPYRVNKATLLEKFAELVRDKKIEGIKNLRDESDKEGIRIVVDLKKEALPNKILNQLFKHTQLQDTFHLNMLALVEGIEPRILNLKMILEYYITHRREVVTRRTKFDLAKTKERVHILEGLKKALDHIDAVIKTIKQSETKEQAHATLQKKFKLTALQSTAILEMRLQALAGLERRKLEEELKEKLAFIKDLEALLGSPKKIDSVIKKELLDLKNKYGDARRTKLIRQPIGEFKVEDLIANEEAIIVVTKSGYVKRLPPDTYRKQSRGGKGVIGMTTKEEDVVEKLLLAETHDDILFFTNKGRVFQTKVYELPEASRQARGQALVNFLALGMGESATAVLTLGKAEQTKYKYLLMGTKTGTIKKTELQEFAKVRRSGLIAIKLRKDDELKWVELTTGHDEVMITTAHGQAIRFKETDVRPMGRTSSGVRGIRFKKNDVVMSVAIIEKALDPKTLQVLVISEFGLGKKTNLAEYKVQRRGGSGIKTMKLTKKTGTITVMHITSRATEADLVVISKLGQTLRTALGQISTLGRATQGVRIIKLEPGDSVASATIV